jgi:hypothetical protein
LFGQKLVRFDENLAEQFSPFAAAHRKLLTAVSVSSVTWKKLIIRVATKISRHTSLRPVILKSAPFLANSGTNDCRVSNPALSMKGTRFMSITILAMPSAAHASIAATSLDCSSATNGPERDTIDADPIWLLFASITLISHAYTAIAVLLAE